MKKLEIKKMSFANSENRMSVEEMENVMAGLTKDCIMAIGGMGLGLAGVALLGAATAGTGAIIVTALGGLSGSIGMSACHGQFKIK